MRHAPRHMTKPPSLCAGSPNREQLKQPAARLPKPATVLSDSRPGLQPWMQRDSVAAGAAPTPAPTSSALQLHQPAPISLASGGPALPIPILTPMYEGHATEADLEQQPAGAAAASGAGQTSLQSHAKEGVPRLHLSELHTQQLSVLQQQLSALGGEEEEEGEAGGLDSQWRPQPQLQPQLQPRGGDDVPGMTGRASASPPRFSSVSFRVPGMRPSSDPLAPPSEEALTARQRPAGPHRADDGKDKESSSPRHLYQGIKQRIARLAVHQRGEGATTARLASGPRRSGLAAWATEWQGRLKDQQEQEGELRGGGGGSHAERGRWEGMFKGEVASGMSPEEQNIAAINGALDLIDRYASEGQGPQRRKKAKKSAMLEAIDASLLAQSEELLERSPIPVRDLDTDPPALIPPHTYAHCSLAHPPPPLHPPALPISPLSLPPTSPTHPPATDCTTSLNQFLTPPPPHTHTIINHSIALS